MWNFELAESFEKRLRNYCDQHKVMGKVIKKKCKAPSFWGNIPHRNSTTLPFQLSHWNKFQNTLLDQKLNLYRMTKPNPVFTTFTQHCGFSPLHGNTWNLQCWWNRIPLKSSTGLSSNLSQDCSQIQHKILLKSSTRFPSNKTGLEAFFPCATIKTFPKFSAALLSWESHTPQLQDYFICLF